MNYPGNSWDKYLFKGWDRWQSLANWDWYRNIYNWQTVVKPMDFIAQIIDERY